MSQLDKAVKFVKHLIKSKGLQYPVAIELAAQEFNINTTAISHKLNPPKRSIKWVKPDFYEEVDEYLKNDKTRDYLAQKGYQFNDEKEVVDFLSKGKMEEISEAKIKGIDNFSTDIKDFKEELREEDYADSYNSMVEDLKREIKITLPAPIVIKTDNRYYGFSGNRRVNLALHRGIPIKFWIVEAPDIGKKQKTLFSSKNEAIQYLADFSQKRVIIKK